MHTVRAVVTLSVVSLLLLVSCAPTAPDHGVVHPASDLPVSSVAVVADAVISRDPLTSNDYYAIEESQDASSWMLESATRIIECKGYRVDRALAPFVGGFLGDGEVAEVAPGIGGATWVRSPPFFVSPAVADDAAYRNALATVLRRVASVDVQGTGPLVMPKRPAVPAQPDWNLLYERLGTDYLLVAVAGGASVSEGQKAGESFLGGCLSFVFSALLSGICSAATGADVTITPGEQSYAEVSIETPSTLRSAVQMFDTRTGNVVWTSTMTYSDIYLLSQRFYAAEWAPSLLADICPPPRQGR